MSQPAFGRMQGRVTTIRVQGGSLGFHLVAVTITQQRKGGLWRCSCLQYLYAITINAVTVSVIIVIGITSGGNVVIIVVTTGGSVRSHWFLDSSAGSPVAVSEFWVFSWISVGISEPLYHRAILSLGLNACVRACLRVCARCVELPLREPRGCSYRERPPARA